MENSLSQRYASAMMKIALEENRILDYQNEAKCILKILEENPKYLFVLDSCLISKEEKVSMLDEAFSKAISSNMLSFLKVILGNGRIRHTKEILEDFSSLCNGELGILEGYVYSVTPLNEKQIFDVEQSVHERLNKKVVLKNRLDSSLIGGIKVVIGDVVLDDSIAHRMEELRKSLLKE